MRVSLLILFPFLIVRILQARILNVPEDYPIIMQAIHHSVAEDTVLVNRGHYQELIRFPLHRVYLYSHYVLTSDTVDISETIIDGSTFSNFDSATVVFFPLGTADSSIFSGFTVTGGIGFREPSGARTAAAFNVDRCSPAITYNYITGNACDYTVVAGFYGSSAVFSHNRIWDNYFYSTEMWFGGGNDPFPIAHVEDNCFGANPSAENSFGPVIFVAPDNKVIINGNRFENITAKTTLAIEYFGTHGEDAVIMNNTFKSLRAIDFFSCIVNLSSTSTILRDNIFSDIYTADWPIVSITSGNRNPYYQTIEGNIFENFLTETGTFGLCLHIQDNQSGEVTDNIFRNIMQRAIYISSEDHPITIARNVFEACSSAVSTNFCVSIMINDSEPVTARENIFRHNWPVSVDDAYPDPNHPIDFIDNYWGDPTGPYHPIYNPNGLGDRIGNNVLFVPWLDDTVFSVSPEKPKFLPTQNSLEVFPNPFNLQAIFKLSVTEPGQYRLDLYDLLGRHVSRLWEGVVVTTRSIPFNVSSVSSSLASGIYFIRVLDGHNTVCATAKAALLK